MELELIRYNSEPDYTDGLMFCDGTFDCFTIEDEHRTEKVYGETRIEDGRYRIDLRTEGGFHERYLRKYGGKFHLGMLHLLDVPNFKYVLIHVGNDDDDTAGCILVGTTADKDKNFIGGSVNAYKDFYPKVAKAILEGEEVYITIKTIA